MTTVSINGKKFPISGDLEMPLLWFIRDVAQLSGTKYGCGQGLCGACTVHVDGDAVRSCQTAVKEVIDKSVTTIEGLSTAGDHPLQVAWRRLNVAQCGYCQPGQLMQAAALFDRCSHPTDAEIEAAMAGNLCRCGTYTRIKSAIKAACDAATR
jgi:isoquinoline 1-oxidoreductase alpha subunit